MGRGEQGGRGRGATPGVKVTEVGRCDRWPEGEEETTGHRVDRKENVAKTEGEGVMGEREGKVGEWRWRRRRWNAGGGSRIQRRHREERG